MYNIGDILILPSYHEPWGLVVNEAMAAGLPVIVSNECGSSLDLVRDGENGYVLSPFLLSGKMLKRIVFTIHHLPQNKIKIDLLKHFSKK